METEAELVTAKRRAQPRQSEKKRVWTNAFVFYLCFTWFDLTGREPLWGEQFYQFVSAAYESASGSSEENDEERAWEWAIKEGLKQWKRWKEGLASRRPDLGAALDARARRLRERDGRG